ncbi:MAG: S41 family peptidase [Bacteroidota bacterium]
MKKITTYIIAIFLLGLTACEKTLLGPEEANDPENIFELVWKGFDENYALFSTTDLDWDEVYSRYRPQVTAQTTDDELWELFEKMLVELNDGHTSMIDYTGRRGISAVSGEAQDEADSLFDFQIVMQEYLTDPTIVGLSETSDEGFVYDMIGAVGYVLIPSMDGDATLTNAAAWTEGIDEVIASFGPNPQGIIVDIRGNGGGYDSNSKRLAGAFASERKLAYTVQTKNGPARDAFDEPKEHFVEPIGTPYTGSVVLLTDRNSVSAAEIFTLLMTQNDNVVLVGDTTFGAFSDASFERFLPNGWVYNLSHQLYLDPNGDFLDGIGMAPDVLIKNTSADIANKRDAVLEKALELLQ